jgi:hypothetical protein
MAFRMQTSVPELTILEGAGANSSYMAGFEETGNIRGELSDGPASC